MSRIGRLPITLPSGVTVEVSGQTVKVVGPKGELSYDFSNKIAVISADNTVKLTKKVEDPESAELYGLTRTLVANMVKGTHEGFKKELEINGIGYRAAVSGSKLTLNLGYSHPIEFIAPAGITITVEKNIVAISGIDKQLVGQVAANIRAFRKPEPYKGKGVKYVTETIRRKAGKTGAK
jgi:large subunit ribosomal protein L6